MESTDPVFKSKMRTNRENVNLFSIALLSYLDTRNPGGRKMHVVDFATEAASFAEAFYYTIDSLDSH